MRCDDAHWQLVLYADGELDPEAAARLELHLRDCPECRAALGRLRSTERAVDAALDPVPPSSDAVRRIRREVKRQRVLRDRTRSGSRVRALVLAGLVATVLAFGGAAARAFLLSLSVPRCRAEIEWPEHAQDDGWVSVRVRYAEEGSGKPVPGAFVSASLEAEGAFGPSSTSTAPTDSLGLAHLRLRAPAAGEEQDGHVTVRVGRGVVGSITTHPIRILPSRRAWVWVESDPVAPGGAAHLCVLVLRAASGRPAAGEPVGVRLVDPGGAELALADAVTGGDGLARTSFEMPSTCQPGTWSIAAEARDAAAETRFRVTSSQGTPLSASIGGLDGPLEVGSSVTATVSAAYDTGGPAAGADVTLEAVTDGGVVLSRQKGMLDQAGKLAARIGVPDDESLAGAAASVRARVADAALVTDDAGQRVPIAMPELRVHVVPRGGALLPERSAALDILVLGPDGSPAPSHVAGTLGGESFAVDTGPDGVAEVWAPAVGPGEELNGWVSAEDHGGRSGVATVAVRPAPPQTILVAPDRGVYGIGESLAVDLYSDHDGLAYLDVVRDGVPVGGTGVQIAGGEARAYVPLDGTLTGTLFLAARWASGASALPYAACVFVQPMEELRVTPDGGALTEGRQPLSVSVSSPGEEPERGMVLAAVRPSLSVRARVATHPGLAALEIPSKTPDDLARAAAGVVSGALLRSEPGSLTRRPSRALLAAIAQPPPTPPRASVSAVFVQDQVVHRLRRLYTSLSLSACGLFAATCLGLVLAGELLRRGALGVGEREVARASLRRTRSDLVISGLCLAAAGALTVYCYGAEGARPALPQSAIAPGTSGARLEPISPLLQEPPGLASEAPAGTRSDVALDSPRAEIGEGPSARFAVEVPTGAGTYDFVALAVGPRGELGYGRSKLTARPLVTLGLDVDPGAAAGSGFAIAVRAVNRGPAQQEVPVAIGVEGCGARLTEEERTIHLGARGSASFLTRAVAESPGAVRVTARVAEGGPVAWEDTRTVIIRDAGAYVALGAGAAGQGGVAIGPPGGRNGLATELRICRGSGAIAGRYLDATTPPWLAIDEPAWAACVASVVAASTDQALRDLRPVAARRLAESARSVVALRAADGFSATPGAEPDVRSTALATVALSRAAGAEPALASAASAAVETLRSRADHSRASMSRSEQALVAWALAEAGASAEEVAGWAGAAARDDAPAPDAECLALGVLAYSRVGWEADAAAMSDRLAAQAEPWSGKVAAPSGRSVFGAVGRAAEANATALSALAFEVAPAGSTPRPSALWLTKRLAGFRNADCMFGPASTNGLCTLALLALAPPGGGRTVAFLERSGSPVREVTITPGGWATVPLDLAPSGGSPLTIRAEGEEPVQYVLAARSAAPPAASGTLTLTPAPGASRVGQAALALPNAVATAASGGFEVRLHLPAGVDPFAPDLDALAASGRLRQWVDSSGTLRLLVGDLSRLTAAPLVFRVRAARVASVPAGDVTATIAPPGAAL